MDSAQRAVEGAAHKPTERELPIAMISAVLLIGGYVVLAYSVSDPSSDRSRLGIGAWAERAMILGTLGILREFFMWTGTPRRRRTAVWGGALLVGLVSATLVSFAPPASGALARYGLFTRGIASVIAAVASCVVLIFPLGWLLFWAEERRRKDLVAFPSRGARIPRKPAE